MVLRLHARQVGYWRWAARPGKTVVNERRICFRAYPRCMILVPTFLVITLCHRRFRRLRSMIYFPVPVTSAGAEATYLRPSAHLAQPDWGRNAVAAGELGCIAPVLWVMCASTPWYLDHTLDPGESDAGGQVRGGACARHAQQPCTFWFVDWRNTRSDPTAQEKKFGSDDHTCADKSRSLSGRPRACGCFNFPNRAKIIRRDTLPPASREDGCRSDLPCIFRHFGLLAGFLLRKRQVISQQANCHGTAPPKSLSPVAHRAGHSWS